MPSNEAIMSTHNITEICFDEANYTCKEVGVAFYGSSPITA